MITSAGVIVIVNNKVLVCHPTNYAWKRTWSLPKGVIENSETPAEAAIREVYEETLLRLRFDSIKDVGEFSYLPEKNLHLFLCYYEKNLNINELACSSYFINDNGVPIKEVDKFALVDFDKLEPYLTRKQFAILNKIFKEENIWQ